MNLAALMAALLLAVGIAAGGYATGHKQATNACQAAKLAPLQSAISHHAAAQAAGTLSDAKSAARSSQTAAVFNGITLGVIDYVQTHPAILSPLPSPLPQGERERPCTLDAVGLRLWAAANANTWFDSAAASIKHAAVPEPAAARERPDQRSLGESPGDRQGLPRVQGPAPGADRAPRSDPVTSPSPLAATPRSGVQGMQSWGEGRGRSHATFAIGEGAP